MYFELLPVNFMSSPSCPIAESAPVAVASGLDIVAVVTCDLPFARDIDHVRAEHL